MTSLMKTVNFTLIYGWLPWRFCLRKSTWCKSVSSLVAEMLVFYRYWTVGRRYLLGSWSSVWSGSWQTRRVLPLKRRSNKVSKNHQTHAIYCTYTVESQWQYTRYSLQLKLCGHKKRGGFLKKCKTIYLNFSGLKREGLIDQVALTTKDKFYHKYVPVEFVKLMWIFYYLSPWRWRFVF